jgi:predicted outer membrane repeat protein
VCFVTTDGTVEDHTDEVAAATVEDPAPLVFAEAGTLRFGAGTYHVLVHSSAPQLRIEGAGPAATVLAGMRSAVVDESRARGGNVVVMTGAPSALEVTNLRIEDGIGPFGGAISALDAGQAVTIQSSEFRRNRSNSSTQAVGGAVAVGGSLVVSDSVFESNEADSSGGAIYALAQTTLRNTVFEANTAYDAGAVMVFGGPLLVDDCDFTDNAAFSTAGALQTNRLDATIDHSSFIGNTVDFGSGGAITQFGGTVHYDATTINANAADRGGGLSIFGGTTEFAASFVDNNAALDTRFERGDGGALWILDAQVTATESSFSGNQAFVGTAVVLRRESARASFTAEHSDFAVNSGPSPEAVEIANLQLDGSSFAPGDEDATFRCDLEGCR